MQIPDEWRVKAKNKVNEILKEAQDSGYFKTPIPIRDVIESYLGDVHCVVKSNSELFPQGVSAFSTKDMNIGWIVVVNGQECTERQRFSAAHELAHIVLFPNQPKTVFCSKNVRGWDEDLCDEFAGDILMPEMMVRELYKATPSPYIEDVARIFKVSKPVAEIQLKRLNLAFRRRIPVRF